MGEVYHAGHHRPGEPVGAVPRLHPSQPGDVRGLEAPNQQQGRMANSRRVLRESMTVYRRSRGDGDSVEIPCDVDQPATWRH